MKFEDLTPEQQEKAKKIKTAEEALAFVKEEGIELTDEEIAEISGGGPRIGHSKFIWED